MFFPRATAAPGFSDKTNCWERKTESEALSKYSKSCDLTYGLNLFQNDMKDWFVQNPKLNSRQRTLDQHTDTLALIRE